MNTEDARTHFADVLAVGAAARKSIEERRKMARLAVQYMPLTPSSSDEERRAYGAAVEDVARCEENLVTLDAAEDDLVRLFNRWLDDATTGPKLDARIGRYLALANELLQPGSTVRP